MTRRTPSSTRLGFDGLFCHCLLGWARDVQLLPNTRLQGDAVKLRRPYYGYLTRAPVAGDVGQLELCNLIGYA